LRRSGYNAEPGPIFGSASGSARRALSGAQDRGRVEEKRRLEIPESFSSIDPLSSEEIADLRQSLRQSPVTALQTVKRKVGAWCIEGDALPTGESKDQCQNRRSAALAPIGSDSLPDGEMEILVPSR
jgi:hypothetical protein